MTDDRDRRIQKHETLAANARAKALAEQARADELKRQKALEDEALVAGAAEQGTLDGAMR